MTSRSKKVEARIIKDRMPPAAHHVICVDFDGCLFPFESETGDMMGRKVPFPGAVDFMKAIREEGWTIVILTSRMSDTWWEAEGWNFEKASIEQYSYVAGLLDEFEIPYDVVTDRKVPATYYLDDRAVEVNNNWPQIADRILAPRRA